MAKRTYYCTKCLKTYRKLVELVDGKVPQIQCKICKSLLNANLSTPSSEVKETIDNGIQTKRVEQLANAPELFEEKEHNGRKKKENVEL